MADDLGEDPKFRGLVSRVKRSSPLGSTIFVGLRAADIALQYTILHSAWGVDLIQSLGGNIITIAGKSYLGLNPYAAILTTMTISSAVKQDLWAIFISEQEMRPSSAMIIAFFNTVSNSLNSLLSLWALSSVAPSIASPSASILDVCRASPPLTFGVTLFAVGIFTELVSEVQRKIFKDNPANKGKPYGGGLFSIATHINYGGYTLWRAGYAIAAAGLPWGAFVGGLSIYEFVSRIIPSLDDYCTQKVRYNLFLLTSSRHNLVILICAFLVVQYREAWVDIKKRVPYRLLPGIY